jgi:DNA-binding response OmpR family regulator
MLGRRIPLIVLATASSVLGDSIAVQLRREGNVVYVTHSPGGCLRVATSVGPDMVLLDPTFPKRLEQLLKAHPRTKAAQVLHLSSNLMWSAGRLTRRPLTAGPHAA